MDNGTASKTRLTKADQDAYMRACEFKFGQPVMMGNVRVIASGSLGPVLVFKIKGRNTEVHAGDPRLLEMRPCDE